MFAFADILEDWRSCKPHGVVLRIDYIDDVFSRAAAHLDDPAIPRDAQEDAYNLFVPVSSGPCAPPLVQMLHVGDGEVVHFLRFWQAFQELRRRLQHPQEGDDDAVCQEILEFRDGLLRRFENGGFACSWLSSEITSIQRTSTDPLAWEPVQAALSDHRARTKNVVFDTKLLRLDEVTTFLFSWLTELVEDYCHGDRSSKVRCVRDVARCTRRDASFHLGVARWDVESALRGLYSSQDPESMGKICDGAWSSHGAKLRKREVECPICTLPYTDGSASVVSQCCFQVLCIDCHRKLTGTNKLFACPFCRKREEFSKYVADESPVKPKPIFKMFRRAGQFANEAGRVFEEFATAFRDSDSRNRVSVNSGSPHAAGTASSGSNAGSVNNVIGSTTDSSHRRRRAAGDTSLRSEAPRSQRPVSSSLPPPRISQPSRRGHAHASDPSRAMRHAYVHGSRGTMLGDAQRRLV